MVGYFPVLYLRSLSNAKNTFQVSPSAEVGNWMNHQRGGEDWKEHKNMWLLTVMFSRHQISPL